MASSRERHTRVSSACEPTLIDEYPAVAASVRQAREAVADHAAQFGADDATIDDIRLAMSEAATNVVMHAYQDEAPGCFRVLAVVGQGQMLVIVEDDGCGLSSPARSPGLGAGLKVMRETADGALFRERVHGGSTVQLRFTLNR